MEGGKLRRSWGLEDTGQRDVTEAAGGNRMLWSARPTAERSGPPLWLEANAGLGEVAGDPSTSGFTDATENALEGMGGRCSVSPLHTLLCL